MAQQPLLLNSPTDPSAAMEEPKPRRSRADSPAKPAKSAKRPRATAESMAKGQRDIAVSEFFAKNRHLLGFDNPRKALLTTVKEAVDNSLDACEEAGILPSIAVVIEDLQPDRPSGRASKASRYRVSVVDNGPGIVRKQVENVFGRLLFGSKFHRLKMSRGQQGIGISAAGMYGLITTGRPMLIQTRPKAGAKAHHIELAMNTKANRAEVTIDETTDDFPLQRLRDLPQVRDLTVTGEPGDAFLSTDEFPTGTSVSIELEGKYQRGRGSVDEFLELTAIANPHAKITLVRPTRTIEDEPEAPLLKGKRKRGSAGDRAGSPSSERDAQASANQPNANAPAGVHTNGLAPTDAASSTTPNTIPDTTQDLGPVVVFPRAVDDLPPETKEIQPHPKGVELGTLLQMLKDFEEAERASGTLYRFLQEKFSRVSPSTAGDFCRGIGVTARTRASEIDTAKAERLFKLFQDAKLPPPPTDCLAPIGVQQLLKGMFKGVRAEFYAASSRSPDVYRGRPFLIEAAIAFGGDLAKDEAARVIRFANRVPLLYQQSACSSFKATTETNWRNYDLQQPRGGLPVGPLVIMIHMASVWVPFTSESKEAIADYDEIRKEMRLALMECGRKLGTYLRKRQRMRREGERRDVFERYIGEIAKAASSLTGADAAALYDALQRQARRRTEIADAQLDDEGRVIKDEESLSADDGVVIVPRADGGEGVGDADTDGGASGSNGRSASGAPRPQPKPARSTRSDRDESDDGDDDSDADTPSGLFADEAQKPASRPKKKVLKKVLKKVRRKRPAP
ncbi:MAG: DNA topoisomerase VI subunit B [Phycisphaerales bacterium]